MYQNYVFDLYGTLVDIHTEEDDRAVWQKLSLLYGYYGAHYTPDELHAAYQRLVRMGETKIKQNWQDDMQVQYAHEAFPEIQIETVFAALFSEKNVSAEPALVLHVGQFFRTLTTQYLRLYDFALQLLQAIRQKGNSVYLLSNAQRIFTEYELHYLDIAKYFDAIFISSDYATKKSDARFFHVFLRQSRLNASDCIMIGNDARCDIAGAKAVGMDTYYIHSNLSPDCEETPKATYVQMHMGLEEVEKRLL